VWQPQGKRGRPTEKWEDEDGEGEGERGGIERGRVEGVVCWLSIETCNVLHKLARESHASAWWELHWQLHATTVPFNQQNRKIATLKIVTALCLFVSVQLSIYISVVVSVSHRCSGNANCVLSLPNQHSSQFSPLQNTNHTHANSVIIALSTLRFLYHVVILPA